jgi:hypothetical protein
MSRSAGVVSVTAVNPNSGVVSNTLTFTINGANTQGFEADVSPKPNGAITIADWAQAGRYVAGLDPIVPAGGPAGPSTFRLGARHGEGFSGLSGSGVRTKNGPSRLRIEKRLGISGWATRFIFFVVELDEQGEENAMGFSVRFEPERLRFAGPALAAGLAGASSQINVDEVANARVGIALALPA